jgi:hypothetical protein
VPAAGPLVSTPVGAGDVQVATVNGKPVWGSCVAAQAARQHLDRDAALRQCIDFELLAQAAAAHDPSDHDGAMKTAVVNRFVELAFEDVYRKPADLGDTLDKVIERNLWRLHRPEYRSSTYVRVVVPFGAGSEVDQHAHTIATSIAAGVGGGGGLFPIHLEDAAHHVADAEHVTFAPSGNDQPKDLRVIWEERPAAHIQQLNDVYGAALYKLTEVGQVSPPIRTKWGWDLILWTGGITAREMTRDELVDEMFPDIRRAVFEKWVKSLVQAQHVQIQIDDANVARLDDQGSGSAAPKVGP